MRHVRESLDETDRRIAAALLVAPRASWRTVARCLDLSERTVVRRAGPLFADGTLRTTVVRAPVHFPELIPLALRLRCRPNRIRSTAAALARRRDTLWVDVLGGGDEICVVAFLEGAEARDRLLLRDLPATPEVLSWTAHALMRVFPAAFSWTGGLLTSEEEALLRAEHPAREHPPAPVPLTAADHALVRGLIANGRAGYAELAERAGIAAPTVRRRLGALVDHWVVRLATEVDLALLGVRADVLLWLTVAAGELDATAERLSRHPQVRFAAATTGSSNLLVAAAATDLEALYRFLTDTIGSLSGIGAIETTPVLATFKRTGLPRQRRG
ncbi:Lrp/AsnC family transcriptional regulator [Streptomyces sp. RB6PN23]|uniref:Lrp/AsnC family transcriptional regulator n=1 Tax=Streptomyces silvisoli TaxID=3034235 RepID=A0ABT5ZEX1_9ACTN|nr:Lrp/AsnC family transcriptional regulator [Streptomyces silvisoli]